jgi:lipopolysaccharide/colanic/teichoic acid biosynthesis glycosyltransferase
MPPDLLDPPAPARVVAPPLDWEALAPRGTYARHGQPLLNGAAALCLLPPALALGLVIALINLCLFRDPRQVFFFQERVGYRGRRMRMAKFRTMKAVPDAFGAWKSGDALRVTAFGRLLRNTHLDELPQLFNVLRGDMHLIGPRPEMVEIETWARSVVPGFHTRLAVKPGITGLAQITQGYTRHDPQAYAQKFLLNDAYRRNLSLRLDFAILWRTVAWIMMGRGRSWASTPGARSQRPLLCGALQRMLRLDELPEAPTLLGSEAEA